MISSKLFCKMTVHTQTQYSIKALPFRRRFVTHRSETIHKLRLVSRRTCVHFGNLCNRLLWLDVDCILREWCARHCNHSAYMLSGRSLCCCQCGGRCRTTTVAHNMHLLWIAAKKWYVLVDPSKGGDHIEQGRVTRKFGCPIAQNAKRAQPILDRHENDAFRCQRISLTTNRHCGETRCHIYVKINSHIHSTVYWLAEPMRYPPPWMNTITGNPVVSSGIWGVNIFSQRQFSDPTMSPLAFGCGLFCSPQFRKTMRIEWFCCNWNLGKLNRLITMAVRTPSH